MPTRPHTQSPRLALLAFLTSVALLAVPLARQGSASEPQPASAASPESPARTLTVALDGSGDYRSIQEAIDHASNGMTIYVKAGEYHEDVTVHSKDGLRLIGEGAERVTVLGRNRVGAFHIGKWPYGATNVQISGMRIKEHGGLALGIFNGRGVLLRQVRIDGLLFGQQVQEVRIEDCTIGGSETTGVQFADTQATLLGNLIHDNDHGITIAGKSQVRLERNIITRSLYEGVVVTDQARGDVVRNTIVKNGGGVAFLGKSTGEARGNIVGLNAAGFIVAPTSSVQLSDNAVYNGERNYLRVDGATTIAPELKPASDLILDPGFVDDGRGDYRLRADSPLTEIGGFPFLGALPPVNTTR